MSDLLTHEKHVAIAASLAFSRAAGFGERDNSLHALGQYAELQTSWMALFVPASRDQVV